MVYPVFILFHQDDFCSGKPVMKALALIAEENKNSIHKTEYPAYHRYLADSMDSEVTHQYQFDEFRFFIIQRDDFGTQYFLADGLAACIQEVTLNQQEHNKPDCANLQVVQQSRLYTRHDATDVAGSKH